jgi:hypothetical protein
MSNLLSPNAAQAAHGGTNTPQTNLPGLAAGEVFLWLAIPKVKVKTQRSRGLVCLLHYHHFGVINISTRRSKNHRRLARCVFKKPLQLSG